MSLASRIRQSIIVAAPNELVEATAEAMEAFGGASSDEVHRLMQAIAPAWVGPAFMIIRHWSSDPKTTGLVADWGRYDRDFAGHRFVSNTIAVYPVGPDRPLAPGQGGTFLAPRGPSRPVVLYDLAAQRFVVEDPFLWRVEFAKRHAERLSEDQHREYLGGVAPGRGPGRR